MKKITKKIAKNEKTKKGKEIKRQESELKDYFGGQIPPFWGEMAEERSKRNGPAILALKIPSYIRPEDYLGTFADFSFAHRVWHSVGNYYMASNRHKDALNIYLSEFLDMTKAQEITGKRIHKGSPLCWASDMNLLTGKPYHAKRFLMLTLCEDAITGDGTVSPQATGSYFRLSWTFGMSDADIKKYVVRIFELSRKYPEECKNPEWILQSIDDKWMTMYPSMSEVSEYTINPYYCEKIIAKLGDGTGIALEKLAEYLLSCIPGCRAKSRQRTPSTDYDIVGVFEGEYPDFRALINKYFVCECKDWNHPVDTSTVLKFTSVLHSINANFGIIFTRLGISGNNEFENAERECVKTYQRDKIVIVILDHDDICNIVRGENFVSLLREKYEKARLDLR